MAKARKIEGLHQKVKKHTSTPSGRKRITFFNVKNAPVGDGSTIHRKWRPGTSGHHAFLITVAWYLNKYEKCCETQIHCFFYYSRDIACGNPVSNLLLYQIAIAAVFGLV